MVLIQAIVKEDIMKRKTLGIISLILTFVMIMSLAACGGNPASKTDNASQAASAAEGRWPSFPRRSASLR